MSFLINTLDFLNYLDSALGVLLFILIYILIVLLILPASWLSIAAGYLYGSYYGSLIVFISAFLGASLAFLISRKFFSNKILKVINKFPKLSLLEKIIQKGGLKLIILTRLSPLFPFSILNYFYGLNKISYRDFAISLSCILPGTYLYCSLGTLVNSLNEIDSLKVNNNFVTTIISIISTSLIIYFLAKYSNEVIEDANNN